MSTRWPDPDFADPDRDKPTPAADRASRFLGMRPAFAGVASPLLVGLALTSIALGRADAPSASPRPTPLPAGVRLLPGPVFQAPSQAAIDLRMVVPARPGIDEAMIHDGRPEVDPRMIVPTSAPPVAPGPFATEPRASVAPRR